MRRLAGLVAIVAVLTPATTASADPLSGRQWGMSMIESDAAHATNRGAGAVVAVVDTGVFAGHPDLGGRLVSGYDFAGNDGDPQDGDGHGTHVTGIVAANEGNGIGVSSVAPDARVMPVKVLDDNGNGFSDDVAAGIVFAADHGADVINLSLGSDVPIVGNSDDIEGAMRHALDSGAVVVAASGNSGLPLCEQPEAEGRLLCVGAVNRRRERSFFSSYGRGLGLVAPGGSGLSSPLTPDEDILSTWNDGGYEEVAGTSQATPHVSGVAALLVSLGVRGQAATNRILQTASDAGPPGPDSEYGAGIVNARAAVAGLARPGTAGRRTGRLGSSARISVRRKLRIRYVLRHGIRVRCLASGSGRCRARASRRRKHIAAGSRRLKAGKSVVVVARVNRVGRRVLRRALRRHLTLRVKLRVTLPGAAPQVRRLTLIPK